MEIGLKRYRRDDLRGENGVKISEFSTYNFRRNRRGKHVFSYYVISGKKSEKYMQQNNIVRVIVKYILKEYARAVIDQHDKQDASENADTFTFLTFDHDA